MSLFVFAAFAIGHGPQVTLSGETILTAGTSGPRDVGIRFNTDGTIDKNLAGSFSQIDTATDWIIPNSAASTDYWVRVVSTPSTDFDTKPVANGTWVQLSAAREWRLTDSGQGDGAKATGNFTMEIRLGSSGAALASATYSLSSEWTV